MPLNVLVVGAGVCGPAFAAMLQAFDHRHHITVVERSPTLRATGQQIDLKPPVIPIMKEMLLIDVIKSHSIAETGLEIVNTNGKSVMRFDFNDKDDTKSDLARSVSSEFEIMRGDLVNLLYEFSLSQRAKVDNNQEQEGGLKYEFGKTISELTPSENGANVTFSDGQKAHYDLVVGADGQGSRTRRLAFGQQASDEAFKSLETHAAFYSIPRIECEGEVGKAYIAPGRRGIMTRTGDRPRTQVFLFSMANVEKLKTVSKGPIDTQKKLWAETFKDAGWQSDRFRAELKNTDDFYACELAQIRMKQWHKDRVVLLGDAGYCPSVMTGMGTTSSLIGSYVLAGELSKPGQDVRAAFKVYETVMKPLVVEFQRMPGAGSMGARWPSSRLAIWFLTNTLWAISSFRIDKIFRQLMPKSKETTTWSLPKYSKLHIR